MTRRNGGRQAGKGAGKGGGAASRGPSGRSYRSDTGLTRQPKKMRGRKPSSQRWLTRQLNDPFVAEAKSRGFRSRAALKLEQIDDRYELLKPGMAIVDLGCAPGGWLQIVADRCRLGSSGAILVGIDLLETDVLDGVEIFVGDMTDPEMLDKVRGAVGGRAHGVMSDMAAATTGHRPTDHLRTTALLEAALDFAIEVLVEDGFFLAKCFAAAPKKAFWRSCRAISPRCGMSNRRQAARNPWKAMCWPPAFTGGADGQPRKLMTKATTGPMCLLRPMAAIRPSDLPRGRQHTKIAYLGGVIPVTPKI